MQYTIMVVARTILLISLVVQEGKQWIEFGGGEGGVGGCGSRGGCGMTKGTFKSDDGNGNEDGQNRLKITKTNQSKRLNYLSQHLTLF